MWRLYVIVTAVLLFGICALGGIALPAAARPMGAVRVRGTVAPHRGRFLMPVGYWSTVALISWGVACAPSRWRRLVVFCHPRAARQRAAVHRGVLAGRVDGARARGRRPRLAGWRRRRCCRAARAGRPRGRGAPRDARACGVAQRWEAEAAVGPYLRAPFFPGRREVTRVRGLAYGDGPHRTLDVSSPRTSRPARRSCCTSTTAFRLRQHGRRARPLIRHLTSRAVSSA